MDLHNVRNDLHEILKSQDLSIEGFARKHDLSSSWLYKFAQGKVANPRWKSLQRVEQAIAAERA